MVSEVALPLKKPVMSAVETSGTQVTVMVVAPEPDRAALRRIFERSRWALIEVATVKEAAAALQQHAAGVLICEAVLPDGTWAEVLDQARAMAFPPPVIVTARQADDDFWSDVLNRGGYNLLGKPFSEKEVFEMVSVAWRHRKDRLQFEARAAG